MKMPLVFPLIPGERTTPKAVVIKKVRRYIVGLTTKRCRQCFCRVGRVAKGFELVVVDDADARDPVTSGSVCASGSRNEIGQVLFMVEGFRVY